MKPSWIVFGALLAVLVPAASGCASAARERAPTCGGTAEPPAARATVVVDEAAGCPAPADTVSACGARPNGSAPGLLAYARCERANEHLVDSLRDGQKALELAIESRDSSVATDARAHVVELLKSIPHVTFEAPAADVSITFDDRAVPRDALSKKFSVDPGLHLVQAHGAVTSIGRYCIKPGDFRTIRVASR